MRRSNNWNEADDGQRKISQCLFCLENKHTKLIHNMCNHNNIIYIYIYAHSEAFELIDRQNKDIHLTQICGHTCHQYLTDIYSNILLDNIPFDTNNPTGFIGNRKQFRHQVTWQYNVQLKETKEQSNYCGLQTSFRHAHCPTVQLFCWCYWN